MKPFLLAISFMVWAGCTMRMPPDFVRSPSGKYKMTAEPNFWTKDSRKWHCIFITLFNDSTKTCDTLQTGASNGEKWAVGWYRDRDTLILNSKDIGIHAWCINTKQKFVPIAVTAAIATKADSILNKRYQQKQ